VEIKFLFFFYLTIAVLLIIFGNAKSCLIMLLIFDDHAKKFLDFLILYIVFDY